MVTKNIKIMKGQFIFLFLLLAVFGCKEDEFDTYSSVNYLSFYNNPATDSIVETFFFHQGKDLFRRVISDEKKIETGAAAHGTEIKDAGFPGLMVS